MEQGSRQGSSRGIGGVIQLLYSSIAIYIDEASRSHLETKAGDPRSKNKVLETSPHQGLKVAKDSLEAPTVGTTKESYPSRATNNTATISKRGCPSVSIHL